MLWADEIYPVGPMKQNYRATDCLCHKYVFEEHILNPLHAKFFRENINIYLHFMSFLHIDKTQVVEIPRWIRQGPAYST